MYRFVRNTALITAAALGAAEFAANINRGANFETDVLQILRNGELNPASASTLGNAITRDPNTLSGLSNYMAAEESLEIARLVTPYDPQQWVVGTLGDVLVINKEGTKRKAQGQLVEVDEATFQNLSEADLFLLTHTSVTEIPFDQTGTRIFTIAEGTVANRCRIVERKGAVIDTFNGTGFRSVNTTRVEIYGDGDSWLGYYSYTDTPVFDMINGGISPHGIFFPGLGQQLQFIENEQEARELLDLALSNCK